MTVHAPHPGALRQAWAHAAQREKAARAGSRGPRPELGRQRGKFGAGKVARRGNRCLPQPQAWLPHASPSIGSETTRLGLPFPMEPLSPFDPSEGITGSNGIAGSCQDAWHARRDARKLGRPCEGSDRRSGCAEIPARRHAPPPHKRKPAEVSRPGLMSTGVGARSKRPDELASLVPAPGQREASGAETNPDSHRRNGAP